MDPRRLKVVTYASAALALLALAPALVSAQQGNTYRIRITATAGEPEPGSGDPLQYREEVVGTIALSDLAKDNYDGQHYVGRRLARSVSAVYRGMRGVDPGEPCAWTLKTTGRAEVKLRYLEAELWELSIVSDKETASIQTDKGSCPASEVLLDRPFLATVVRIEGPTPLAAGRVYRLGEDRDSYTVSLAVLDVCDGTTFRDGPKDARSESVRDAVAGGMHARGSSAGPEVVGIKQTSILEFNVRLGPGHQPLPNRACLEEHIKAGEIDDGALSGATHLLVGGVQEAGGETRVTVRTIDVATGEVVATGKADASGPDAVGAAMRQAIAQLGWTFGG